MRPEPATAYGLACLSYLLTAEVIERAHRAGQAGYERHRNAIQALRLPADTLGGRFHIDDGTGVLHEWLPCLNLLGLINNLPALQAFAVDRAEDWPGAHPAELIWRIKVAGEPTRVASVIEDCGDLTIARCGDTAHLFPADNPRGAARAHVLLAELTACALLPWRP